MGGRDLSSTAVYPGTLALNVACLALAKLVGAHIEPPIVVKVGDLLDEHFKNLKPIPAVDELDMELIDSADTTSSDSGLEDLVGPAP